ncbi:MAG: V-type ATP synthase subunit D [Lentisphaeria bacterium]|nr:V-type ATP synthase subunit D [Lentisphaeria bacterium]
MAKIKLTKNELKAQRDGLKRFLRYLPTLQLKKQQLQLEVRQVREVVARMDEERRAFLEGLSDWVAVLDDGNTALLGRFSRVETCGMGTRNVAGIDTPVVEDIVFAEATYDLFATPAWFEDALDSVRRRVEMDLRLEVAREQLELLERELQVVTQRVNLFEKVKIPAARENIRRIQISLGDQQTNAVGRAKIAKAKCQAREQAPGEVGAAAVQGVEPEQ